MERWEGEQRPAGGGAAAQTGFTRFRPPGGGRTPCGASLPAVRQQKALRRSRGAIVFILIYCR